MGESMSTTCHYDRQCYGKRVLASANAMLVASRMVAWLGYPSFVFHRANTRQNGTYNNISRQHLVIQLPGVFVLWATDVQSNALSIR